MKTLFRITGPLAVTLLVCGAQTLQEQFQNPPNSAKPRVWWHWMNGNITKEGIQRDLEWMKRAGIGGFQNFDAQLETPQVVERRLAYMTPEWKDTFRFAASLADRLGLEMAIAGSPGWSESGGPWVPPAQAMKKLVWSETRVAGGRPFSGTLAKPPSVAGPFQSLARKAISPDELDAPDFYADAAVIAYRIPEGDVPMAELAPKVTASGGHFELAQLTDGDLTAASALPAGPNAWIQFDFAAPRAVRAFTLARVGDWNYWLPDSRDSGMKLEASDDGANFRFVAKVPGNGGLVHTVAFPATTARFFRMSFPPSEEQKISEFVLHTGARVNLAEVKAGYATMCDLSPFATPAGPAVPKAGVVDLTARMGKDGHLEWNPPAGNWMVLRLGYSLTGTTNGPATREATGLEVDKLNRAYVKNYLDNYLGQYQSFLGELMGKRGLHYVITDSWEAGPQNWTDQMIPEFTRRSGYDPRPWLPVLTGRVVESAEASDRFLWDFRKTIGELTADNHYDQITASLRERGMARYSESQESHRAFVGDGMEMKRTAEVPMSAMWTSQPGVETEQYGYNADIRESASVAHIYGQNLVAAESLTAHRTAWQWSPETLKPTADKELAMGLNRFVIHTSVHQPVSDKIPGLSLGPYGQWFTRHETWAEQALPWTTYLARSSFLLQQGKFSADIAYFYGEDSNATALFAEKSPDVPAGYSFDFVNADALVNVLTMSGGRITTPSGMSYRALMLDANCRHMSLPVLRKIRDLVKEGAIVIGPKPVSTPSLADDEAEFREIADKVFTRPAAQVLADLGIAPDFEYSKPAADTNLLFVHRRLPEADVYWVDSRNARSQTVEASFRVEGKAPELWHADTGKMEPAPYRITNGRTRVTLRLDPYEAVFVVFREPAATPERKIAAPVETVLASVEGPWKLAFQPDRGAPGEIALEKLASWSEQSDPGVKYFSGTATYSRSLEIPLKPGKRIWLDLGEVRNLAEVAVNGKPLGILWKAPFRVDVTDAVRTGTNILQVKVTNLWVNRLVGDAQPGVTRKYTYTAPVFYKADSPLLPSGLLGPVRLLEVK